MSCAAKGAAREAALVQEDAALGTEALLLLLLCRLRARGRRQGEDRPRSGGAPALLVLVSCGARAALFSPGGLAWGHGGRQGHRARAGRKASWAGAGLEETPGEGKGGGQKQPLRGSGVRGRR